MKKQKPIKLNLKAKLPKDKLEDDYTTDDPVNHPAHYTSHPSGIECIEVVRHMNFNCGNAVKYIWRNGIKSTDTAVQDLEKAAWYINDQIELLRKK